MSHRRIPHHSHTSDEVLGQSPYINIPLDFIIPDWESLIRKLQSCTLLSLLADAFFKANAESRAKFENLFVTTALIDNAAITNAKIGNLQVDTAKITDLAVTNAKIANAAIDNAKIQDATIQGLKLVDGTIEFVKTNIDFPWQVYGANNKIIASFEALTGYDQQYKNGSATFEIRHNALLMKTGTTTQQVPRESICNLMGYKTILAAYDPQFKARIKFLGSGTKFDMEITVGTPTNNDNSYIGFGFTVGNFAGLAMGSANGMIDFSNVHHTVNNVTTDRAGLFDSDQGESAATMTRGYDNRIRAKVYKVSTSGSLTLQFTTQWVTMPTIRDYALITYSAAAVSLAAGETLYIVVQFTDNGGVTDYDAHWFITKACGKALSISATDWKFCLLCKDDTSSGELKFFYGNPYPSNNVASHVIVEKLMLGTLAIAQMKKATVLAGYMDNNYHILRAAYDSATHTINYYLDEVLLATDNYFTLPSDLMRECNFYLWNNEAADYQLEISHWTVQEKWQQ